MKLLIAVDSATSAEVLANIYITKAAHERLTKLIEIARERESDANREYLDRLEEELDRAEVVQQKDIPADVITMRSTVRLKDLDTSEKIIYRLVFPTEANYDEGKISVLAPSEQRCSVIGVAT